MHTDEKEIRTYRQRLQPRVPDLVPNAAESSESPLAKTFLILKLLYQRFFPNPAEWARDVPERERLIAPTTPPRCVLLSIEAPVELVEFRRRATAALLDEGVAETLLL